MEGRRKRIQRHPVVSSATCGGSTYVVVLLFLAVVVAHHRLGLPSTLPLLALVVASRLLAQLDLHPHRLGCKEAEPTGRE